MADVFSNSANNYVYPALSPCQNVADDQYLVWDKNGLTIIKGSEEVASIMFSDVTIPVSSFNKQQLTLNTGEVAFIQGLTKGLCNRRQGFTMPSLVSSDIDLNPYFFQIDFSINYYTNFSFTYSNIDASANYAENISLVDSINIVLSDAGIKIESSYDPSTLYLSGTQEGYDFQVSNVLLTIIDTSINASSPFAHGTNATSYELVEDASAEILYAKYPNTAMQGIALKGIYPDLDTVYDEDRWFYLNHISDYAVVYDPINVSYDSEVSTGLNILYDPSTFIGTVPTITVDLSLYDVSTLDSSGLVIADSSLLDSLLYDSSITNSFILDSSVYDSYIGGSVIETVVTSGTVLFQDLVGNVVFSECKITDSSITNSIINNLSDVSISLITNSWTNIYKQLVYTDPSGNQTFEYATDASLLRVNVYESTIWDSSLYNTSVYDSSVYRSYINHDVSLVGCTLYNCTYDASAILNNSRDILIDPSIGCVFDIIEDTSTFYLRHRKKIEVGMSGCSIGESISAGDYLNMVTVNNMWKKVGDMYIWTSSPDPADCTIKNLIEGFYVFNPHEFVIKVEYLVFV